jgi:hypothetical protein
LLPFIASCFTADEAGVITNQICIEGFELPDTSRLLDDPVFQQARRTGRAQVSPIEAMADSPVIKIVYPLTRKEGYVFIYMQANTLRESIADIANISAMKICLVDGSGRILLDSSSKEVGKVYILSRSPMIPIGRLSGIPKGYQ